MTSPALVRSGDLKRNPQAVAAERVMQQLLVWRHWDDFVNHRHRKPWMWGQPILAPKKRKGSYRARQLFVHPFITRRDHDGISLRMVQRVACGQTVDNP